MRRSAIVAAFLGACALLGAAPLNGGELLGVKVSPAVAIAPASLSVRVTLEPHDANRSLEMIVESSDFYRSSWRQLDGTKAPRVSVFEFSHLPAGAYEVTGILGGPGGRRAAASRLMRVMRSPGSN